MAPLLLRLALRAARAAAPDPRAQGSPGAFAAAAGHSAAHSTALTGVLTTALSAVLSAAATPPALARPAGGPPPQVLPIEARWCPPGRSPATGGCIALEVPRTWRQYGYGLQLRPPLPRGRGMWFPYRPAQVARFWMHRTPHPLDLIWVQANRVVAIEAAAAPCPRLPCRSYGPSVPVDGVLELGAGEAARLGLRPGSPLRVELLARFAPQAPAPD